MSSKQQTLSVYESGPVKEYFLRHIRQSTADRTTSAYERVLDRFDEFLRDRATTPAEATSQDCLDWVNSLREESYSEATIGTYFAYVRRFYKHLNNDPQVTEVDHDPTQPVSDLVDERVNTSPDRRDISLGEMRAFARGIRHPVRRAIVGVLLKTGMRAGELCNLDCRDIYLPEEHLFQSPRDELVEFAERTDLDCCGFLYLKNSCFDSNDNRPPIKERQNDAIVPIDSGLADVLTGAAWVRPDPISDEDPLFCSTSRWGQRLTLEMVGHAVKKPAREMGWYETGGGAENNVTPHYFRHFFTTHLRQESGDTGLVEYFRGDATDRIVDTYTHGWGDEYQRRYLENIYSIYNHRSCRPERILEVTP